MAYAVNAADRVYWFLVDNLGTVRDIVDNDGEVIAGGHFTYDAFGRVLSGDLTFTRHLYTAREFEAITGLQYNRMRWYDPVTGRFLSEDPIAADVNLYRYGDNSPTNATDPDGLQATVSRFFNVKKGYGELLEQNLYPNFLNRVNLLWLYQVPTLTPKSPVCPMNTIKARQSESAFALNLAPWEIVGSSGASTCLILVIEGPGFGMAWHFEALDSIPATLARDLTNFQGGRAAIAGDADDKISNYNLHVLLKDLQDRGIPVVGFHWSDQLWVDSKRRWVKDR